MHLAAVFTVVRPTSGEPENCSHTFRILMNNFLIRELFRESRMFRGQPRRPLTLAVLHVVVFEKHGLFAIA